MATHKKAGRKAHVGRPSNEEIAKRKAKEMEGTNPKADAKAQIKEGADKAEDAGKTIMSGVRQWFSTLGKSIGKFFTGAFGLMGGFIKGIGEGLVNLGKTVIAFLKGFTDKVKLHTGASRAKLIFSLILILSTIVLAGGTILTYFTLEQVALAAAGGCVLSYGVQRATMPEDLRKASTVSVKEMFMPTAVKAA